MSQTLYIRKAAKRRGDWGFKGKLRDLLSDRFAVPYSAAVIKVDGQHIGFLYGVMAMMPADSDEKQELLELVGHLECDGEIEAWVE